MDKGQNQETEDSMNHERAAALRTAKERMRLGGGAARLEAQRFGMELLVSDPGPVLGVLSAFAASPERPDREDRLGLEEVGHQLAVALEVARWRTT